VYLDEVAILSPREGPTRLLRRDRRPVAFVTAELAPGVDLGTATRTAGHAVDRLRAESNSPLRFVRREDLRWSGDVEGMFTSFRDVSWTLVFALGLAYMLMAMLFNSYVRPLTIMLTMPMALVGAILALLATHTSLSVVAMVGMVMLIGLVSRNSILIDYTNTLRSRDGMERNQAVLTAAPVRLRPILMTTLSTTLATLPVALGIGRASEIRAPMRIVAIGGLALSTLLSLIVIPVVYTYANDLTNAVLRLGSRLAGRTRPAPPAKAAPPNSAHADAETSAEPRLPVGAGREARES
jgi:HAE1 family hydrophobic/amphiphilic exporter-1